VGRAVSLAPKTIFIATFCGGVFAAVLAVAVAAIAGWL
jgi:hypothetical protein